MISGNTFIHNNCRLLTGPDIETICADDDDSGDCATPVGAAAPPRRVIVEIELPPPAVLPVATLDGMITEPNGRGG
jgi:hypothetical protein